MSPELLARSRTKFVRGQFTAAGKTAARRELYIRLERALSRPVTNRQENCGRVLHVLAAFRQEFGAPVEAKHWPDRSGIKRVFRITWDHGPFFTVVADPEPSYCSVMSGSPELSDPYRPGRVIIVS